MGFERPSRRGGGGGGSAGHLEVLRVGLDAEALPAVLPLQGQRVAHIYLLRREGGKERKGWEGGNEEGGGDPSRTCCVLLIP